MTPLPSDPQVLLSDPPLLLDALRELSVPVPTLVVQTYASYDLIPIPEAGYVTVAWVDAVVVRVANGVVFAIDGSTYLYDPEEP